MFDTESPSRQICTEPARPNRIGPTTVTPPSTWTNLVVIAAEWMAGGCWLARSNAWRGSWKKAGLRIEAVWRSGRAVSVTDVRDADSTGPPPDGNGPDKPAAHRIDHGSRMRETVGNEHSVPVSADDHTMGARAGDDARDDRLTRGFDDGHGVARSGFRALVGDVDFPTGRRCEDLDRPWADRDPGDHPPTCRIDNRHAVLIPQRDITQTSIGREGDLYGSLADWNAGGFRHVSDVQDRNGSIFCIGDIDRPAIRAHS